MAQHGFNQFGGGQNSSGSVDPNDLAMSANYGNSFANNFGSSHNASNGFSSGSALFDDDELLDGLGSPTSALPNQTGMQNPGQDFGGMNDMNMAFSHNAYQNNAGLQMDQQQQQQQVSGYSNTPDGDPIQSPFVHNFNQTQFRQMQSLYSGSVPGSELNGDNNDPKYLNAQNRARLSQAMQRKASNTRSPLTPKSQAAMTALNMDSPGFGAQPIRTTSGNHEQSPSNQWMHTPNSLSSFPGSGFSSPMQHGVPNPQIADVLLKGGTSMPAKLGNGGNMSSQEMKRKRRRESHNLVERRRRDNINERIQDLSKLVPIHRLEDEKIRKLITSGTPLSPTLTGLTHPVQATSGLAGPGAKRATGAGNITTGLPLEDKDKGPNKGDILNGAVSWTRDLMWMLHRKLQQQEDLINAFADKGLPIPLSFTDDERRMQSELMEAISKNGPDTFSYSRFNGSGLRVPHHTDYKGDPLDGSAQHDADSVSPDIHETADIGEDMGADQFWAEPDDDGTVSFKEEDEYMDLGQ